MYRTKQKTERKETKRRDKKQRPTHSKPQKCYKITKLETIKYMYNSPIEYKGRKNKIKII